MKQSRNQLWLLLAGLAITLATGQIASAQSKKSSYDTLRDELVRNEIAGAGIKDPRVIESVRNTPRHEFVAGNQRDKAYFDMALPIGDGQTISPPFVVAYMTEQLRPSPEDKVLEIGTGSGYQAAILSPLVKEVYSIEIVKPLGERAARTLKRLGYTNVFTKVGDGYQGWPEHAPFDKIIVTCSPENVPPKLVEQLRDGGMMIVPVGERYQQTLYRFIKRNGKLESEPLLPTLFVPMTGIAESQRAKLPDPANPRIENGGFEELLPPPSDDAIAAERGNSPDMPLGWHYQRQLTVHRDAGAPQGKNYITFNNDTPGRNAMALQGMAIDGREVPMIEVCCWVRGDKIERGQRDYEQAMLMITFYDERRAQVGHSWLGPWSGSFSWRELCEQLDVPPKAREAIVRIGLHGDTGEVAFDGLSLRAVKK